MRRFGGAGVFDQLSPGVRRLLFLNVGIFFVQMVWPEPLLRTFGLIPSVVFHKYWVWQLVTYAFLHGGGWHLFFNMFALWMFGPHVENYWGTRTFIKYYFLCVIGAALTQCAVAPNALVIGASGGIYGILIAFGLLFPDAVIYMFFVFPMRALQAVLLIGAMTLFSALSAGGSRVAHFAHLGGMLAGFLYFKLPPLLHRFRSGANWGRFSKPFRRKPKLDVYDLSKDVDRILDKISSQGIDSLTPEEHKTMERYARKKG